MDNILLLPPSLPPSLQVVFIPTYLLLLSFLIAVGVHSFYLFLLLPLLSSRRRPPCEQHAQRLADIIKTLSAVGVVITATLFLVCTVIDYVMLLLVLLCLEAVLLYLVHCAIISIIVFHIYTGQHVLLATLYKTTCCLVYVAMLSSVCCNVV